MPPTVFPKGVTIHETDKAHDCHVMYEGRGGESYLIDMAGDIVRQWPHTGFPAEMIDPAVNGGKKGHVLLQREPDTFFNETVLEMDWDANVVWEWGDKAPGGKARQNHDLCRLASGNTMVISKKGIYGPGSPSRRVHRSTPLRNHARWRNRLGVGAPRTSGRTRDRRTPPGGSLQQGRRPGKGVYIRDQRHAAPRAQQMA